MVLNEPNSFPDTPFELLQRLPSSPSNTRQQWLLPCACSALAGILAPAPCVQVWMSLLISPEGVLGVVSLSWTSISEFKTKTPNLLHLELLKLDSEFITGYNWSGLQVPRPQGVCDNLRSVTASAFHVAAYGFHSLNSINFHSPLWK